MAHLEISDDGQRRLNNLMDRLEVKVQDEEFPITAFEYESEIKDAILSLGYESIDELPAKIESLVLLKCQINFYYMLAGKHARNYRVRVEGDMEVHAQQVAGNYLSLADTMETRLEKEMEKLAEIEMIEATRYRVSTIGNVPKSTGVKY